MHINAETPCIFNNKTLLGFESHQYRLRIKMYQGCITWSGIELHSTHEKRGKQTGIATG